MSERKIKIRIPSMMGDKQVEMSITDLSNSRYSHYLLFNPNSKEQVKQEDMETLDLRPLDYLVGIPPISGG